MVFRRLAAVSKVHPPAYLVGVQRLVLLAAMLLEAGSGVAAAQQPPFGNSESYSTPRAQDAKPGRSSVWVPNAEPLPHAAFNRPALTDATAHTRLAQAALPPVPSPSPGTPVPTEPNAPPLPPARTSEPAPSAAPSSRFELLPGLPPALAFPAPSAEAEALSRRFLQRTIDPQQRLDLIVGHPRLLVFSVPPKRISLPDQQIASYQLISETEISLIGVRPGTTVLHVWVPDPQVQPRGESVLSYLISVVPQPRLKEDLEARYRALEQEINRAFPNSHIELSLIGDRLVVRGTAHDVVEATHILSILAQHSPRPAYDRYGQEVQLVQQLGPGSEEDPLRQQEESDLRRAVIDPRALAAAGIVNLLRIPGEQQVMLRVTVAEVNRSAARSIGLNFSVANNQGNTVFRNLAGNLGTQAGATGPNQGLANMLASLDNGQVLSAINALRTLKLAKTLAEPNLVTLNGHPANFQAGGRFPVPVLGGFTGIGLQGVNFVPFGVQLQFTPYIVDRDRIRLNVRAEVSTRDEAVGTQIGGGGAGSTQVSGLSTRNFATTVELREGQTLAVAGLIQHNFGADADRVPLWGDLPILGFTGGFNRTSSGEQELVILITPELVHPLPACDTPGLPGSDVFEPGDVEFYLANRLESRRSRDWRASVRTDWHKIRMGDKSSQDCFLIGPFGPTYGCCPPAGSPWGGGLTDAAPHPSIEPLPPAEPSSTR